LEVLDLLTALLWCYGYGKVEGLLIMRAESFETAFDCDLSILGDSLAVIIVLSFFICIFCLNDFGAIVLS